MGPAGQAGACVVYARYSFGPGFTREEEIADLLAESCRIQVGAIAENDDRQVVACEALDESTKANRLAVVPHPRMALVGIQEPAEPVGGKFVAGAVGIGLRDGHWEKCGLHFLRAQERVACELVVPLGQVGQGRVDSAVAQGC